MICTFQQGPKHPIAGRPAAQRFGWHGGRSLSAQTMVEFAFILPILLILMLGVIQMVLVGGAALAVNEAAVASARYAALNSSATESTVDGYLKSIASPLIADAHLQPVVLNPTTPRHTGNPVSVTVTYNMEGKLFLGSSFIGITFPDHISVTQTMTSE